MAELVCGFASLFYLVLQVFLPLLQVAHEGHGKRQGYYSLDLIHCEIPRVVSYACNFNEVKGVYQKFAMHL